MIFTILGVISAISCFICFVLFLITITQPISTSYLFMFISCLVNCIVFFTLAKMKNDIEETKKILSLHEQSNFSHKNKFDGIETEIIKIKQKLNKKDGE
jgi:ABC-type Fe3+-siderophore transport system permease subunit